MAKLPGSAIGIDIGRHTSKAVLLTRKGAARFTLAGFAVCPNNAAIDSSGGVAEQVQELLKKLGGSAKAYSVCISSPDAIIRIIEQPETPTDILRDAVRLNGMSLLNQDVKSFVLDCDKIGPARSSDSLSGRMRYLVGALPREQVTHIHEGIQKLGGNISLIQMGPIAAFNAFEFAEEDTFNSEAFMLVDVGHNNSTVTIGVKRELLMVRSIEYGAQALLDALVSLGGGSRPEAIAALEKGDEMMAEAARLSLTALTREISNSIGFVEGYCDQSVARIQISGGAAKSKRLLEILREDLHMPCETWNPFEHCEISVPTERKPELHDEIVNLNIACGAAIEALRGR
jgi:type IV pilus assembly protein PilM